MYYLLSYDSVISFFATLGVDLTLLTQFQLTVIWLLSNIFTLFFWIFIISICYKIMCRFFRF